MQLSSLHKAFGARVLFDKINWQVQPGQRVGLCGPNGAGKTTLLRLMSGDVEPDAGAITKPNELTVGYLPQDGLDHQGKTLYDEVSSAFAELLELQIKMRTLERLLGDETLGKVEHDAALESYSVAQETFHHQDGYGIEAKVSSVLHGLGFSSTDLERNTEHFSGGWQMRIALAKLLLRRPHVLLLDEPTNHLDLDARNWLEGFLVGYPHAVILVSHDRFFLDSVVTAIAEVDMRTLTTYPGSYSQFLVEREERVTRLRAAKQKQDEDIARMRMFIDRFRYQATKAKQVQSRIKMLDKIVPIEVPLERKKVRFSFPISRKSGRQVLELKDAAKSYGPISVFSCINVNVERGDRVALVGPNGTGKSTLMRMLSGVERPDSGQRMEGHNVITQYFAQDEATRLNDSLSVYETLASGSPVDMVPGIRNILGGFLFTEDDVYKRVKVLSGGERTRLAVARMLLKPSNTLLLDEPTNHLDIDSTNVLLDALSDYGGTLIFVSHDRYFVDQLATKIIEIGDGNISTYPGTYEDFRWSKEQNNQTKQRQSTIVPKKPPKHTATISEVSTSTTAAEHKRLQVENRRRQKRIDTLRSRISDLEKRIATREEAVRALEVEMSTPDFYSDQKAAEQATKRHQTLMWEVGDLMNQWEALEQEMSLKESSL